MAEDGQDCLEEMEPPAVSSAAASSSTRPSKDGVYESKPQPSPGGKHFIVAMERTSTGGTRREAQMKRATSGPMSGAERKQRQRVRASLFPAKVATLRDKDAERNRVERKRKADEAALNAAVEDVVATLVAAVEKAAATAEEAESSVGPAPRAKEDDFERRMILKAAANSRRNSEAVVWWAPQLPQTFETGAFRRVRMRSIAVHWSDMPGPSLETYSDCEVIFCEHCIWIGTKFHIWYPVKTESGRCDGGFKTRAIYSHHAIELSAARIRLGEGCSRHRLTITNPTAALLAFRDVTATRRMGGFGDVRSFKEKVPYALSDGACKACKTCREGEPPSYSARVVMVLEGSAEPQRYKEQMKALMPRIVSSLVRGFYFTMPLSRMKDRRTMGDNIDMRACVCSLCTEAEPEPEPEPEPEEEEGESEWDE